MPVPARRPKGEWAPGLRDGGDGPFPAADTIVVGSDPVPPLNPAALDEAVAPEEARRSIEKPEWHYPPKHGSWLERAESALRVLQRQGFDRRIPDPQT